jgi:hypothetical protein
MDIHIDGVDLCSCIAYELDCNQVWAKVEGEAETGGMIPVAMMWHDL